MQRKLFEGGFKRFKREFLTLNRNTGKLKKIRLKGFKKEKVALKRKRRNSM